MAAFLTSGGYTLANLIASLGRNKGLAVLLGPDGLGQWSQVMSFTFLVQTAATLGVTTGVTRYVGQYRREGRDPGDVVRSALLFVGGGAFLLGLALFAASPWLARLTVDRADWWWVVGAAGLAAPLISAQSVYQAGLQGAEDYRGLAFAGIASAGAALAVSLLAAWLWGAKGVAFFVAGSFLLNALFHAVRLRRSITMRLSLRIDRDLVRALLAYGGVTIVGAVTASVGNLAGRSVLLHEYGATANGYYQALSGLTLQILPVFLSAITMYVVPKLGGISDRRYTSELVARVIRAVCLLVLPLLAGGVIFREWFLAILFSPEFVLASPWLPVQFTGDVFLALAWATGSFLLPTGRFRIFLVCESIRAGVFLGLAVLFLRLRMEPLGVGALASAHLLAYGLETVMFLVAARRTIGFSVGASARILFTGGVAWIGVVALSWWLPLVWRAPLGLLLLLAYLGMALNKDEWASLKSLLQRLRWARPGA